MSNIKCLQKLCTHIHTTNVIVVASHIKLYFPDNPTMGTASSVPRTVAGTAAAGDRDTIKENGERQLFTHVCTMLCRDRGSDWFNCDISTELHQLCSDICDTCSVSACH